MNLSCRKALEWNYKTQILHEFINREFDVYTGNKYIPLKVTNDMLGHKFGEFASTRRYSVKKKKKGKK